MIIYYDASVLGSGITDSRAKTGVFRVVEELAIHLSAIEDCEVTYFTPASNCVEVLKYFKSESVITDPVFSRDISRLEKSRLLRLIFNLEDNISNSENRTLLVKVLDRLKRHAIKYLDNRCQKSSTKDPISDVDVLHTLYYSNKERIQKQNGIKYFQTVYDLIPILFPEYYVKPFDLRSYIESNYTYDDYMLCISEATRNDLLNVFDNLDPDKCFVTLLAASDKFQKCENEGVLRDIKHKYRIPSDDKYILSVCTLEPRKNIGTLIKSFADLILLEKIDDLSLVLTGTKGWDYESIYSEIENTRSLKDKIILTGYVDDCDLSPLYTGALAFVYPSLYEGFGLPPLEAMQCGTPVITSKTSSLPEVVGAAGILIDPRSSDEISHAILEIYNSSSLQEKLSMDALQRSREFTWANCAMLTFNAYKKALGY